MQQNLYKEVYFSDLWTDEATTHMLDKYELYMPMIGPMKKFKKKKTMWEQISADLENELKVTKTAVQVENRYKTLLKRKKKAIENNSKSGAARMEVPFEESLKKIAALDDSIEPETLRSANQVRMLKKPYSETEPSTSKLKRPHETEPTSNELLKPCCETELSTCKKYSEEISFHKKKTLASFPPRKTIQQTLLDIHKEREKKRDERHREKVALLTEIFKIKKALNEREDSE